MGKQGSPRMLGTDYNWNKAGLFHGFKNDPSKISSCKGVHGGKRHVWLCKNLRSMVITFGLIGFLFLLDSLVYSILEPTSGSAPKKSIETMKVRVRNFLRTTAYEVNIIDSYSTLSKWFLGMRKERTTANVNEGKIPVQMYDRLMNLASFALAEVCNAVAVASLLNATLVIPKFLYSNVWKDPSQFGDIYQLDHFTNNLKDDVNLVKELPSNLKSLNFEAIGSLITDADIPKEATPADYVKTVLPLLLKNRVVHLLGFGNRLGFDPLPFELQRLRCKCNFHALKFAPEIERVGSLLIKRIRKFDAARNMLDKQLLGNFMSNTPLKGKDSAVGDQSKYFALHLRFEVDMVAYSQCEFGGGEDEREELRAYRESHFPLLAERLDKSKPTSPTELRRLGKCPLTPEEAALVLAGLGFNRETFIYLAGSRIYGGQSRMQTLSSLYPNLVTKEDLLTRSELKPFRNFSSQLAALDFIACATADVFAMTDSGSQLSSLVSGFRTYYGGGHAPTLRPIKKRLAAILLENSTIAWNSFEERIQKMIEEGQRVGVRGNKKSIYRQPRCPECMCKYH
ncbi:hypothetical protein C3L33_15600, partial [Rhododendron williamsianum]